MFASGMSSNTAIGSAEKLSAGDKFDPNLHATNPLGNTKTRVATTKKVVDDFKL
jgi:hypothetical protein